MSNSEDLYGLAPMVIIRHNFLSITDQNVCAASMLDRFNARVATDRENAWYDEKYHNKQFDSTVECSIKYLSKQQCGIFSEDEIVCGLKLLRDKGYIRVINKIGYSYTLFVDKEKIDREIYPQFYSSQEIETVQTVEPQSSEESCQEPTETQPVSDARESKIANRGQSRRVEYHNNRASRVGLPATLTVTQWIKTLDHFEWKCAFCSEGAYEVVEHFVPIIHGGGTTEYNCTPACASCNRIKNDTHPSMIKPESPIYQSIQNVQKYLESRRVSVESDGEL